MKISEEFGLRPFRSWAVGDERRTPTGRRLPGTATESFWTTSLEDIGDKAFFEGVMDLVGRLEGVSEFIRLLDETGGTTSIIVQLPGKFNKGDEMNWTSLGRLAALKINLGIEVFPEYN